MTERNMFILTCCGLGLVIGALPPKDARRFAESHAWARADIERLRGIWRDQDRYFAACDLGLELKQGLLRNRTW